MTIKFTSQSNGNYNIVFFLSTLLLFQSPLTIFASGDMYCDGVGMGGLGGVRVRDI